MDVLIKANDQATAVLKRVESQIRGVSRAANDASKSADSLEGSLSGIARATNAYATVVKRINAITDAIMRAQAAAAKNIEIKVVLKGHEAVIQKLESIKALYTSLGNNDPPTLTVNVDVAATLAAFKEVSAGAENMRSSVIESFRRIRLSAVKPVTLKVTAETVGFPDALAAVEAFREAAVGGDTVVRVHAVVDGIAEAIGQLDLLDRTADRVDRKWSHSVRIHAVIDGIAKVLAELKTADTAAGRLDGRKINMSLDMKGASALPTLLGDAFTQLGKFQVIVAAVAAVAVPALIASVAGLGGALVAAGTGAVALGAGLAAGLAGGAGVAGAAIGQLLAGGYAASGMMAQAFANATLLGHGFGTLQGEVKSAKDQLKAAEDLVSRMPAGTAAAAAAQQHLAQTQFYQAKATQAQVDWWGKYGAQANMLSSLTNTLRLVFVRMSSDIGGQLLPTLINFVAYATANLYLLRFPLQAIVDGTIDAAGGFLAMLKSADTLVRIGYILNSIGSAAGPALNILTNGFIIALYAVTPLIGHSNSLITALSKLSTVAVQWTMSAEGSARIAEIWARLVDYASMLGQAMLYLGGAAATFFASLGRSGMIDFMVQGFVDMAARINGVVQSLSVAGGGFDQFFSVAMPILTSIMNAAGALISEVFRVVGAVTSLRNETTGSLVIVDIFNAIADSARMLGDLLINTFADLGPLFPDLIRNLSELAMLFLGSTSELTFFVSGLNTLMTAFNSLPDPVQQTAARVLALSLLFGSMGGGSLLSFGAGILGAVTNLRMLNYMSIAATGNMTLFGRLMSGIGPAFAGIGSALATAGGAVMTFLGSLVALNPVTWAIVAAVAAVAGAAYLIYSNWGTIGPWLSGIWESIKTTVATAVDAIIQTLVAWGTALWQAVQPALEQLRSIWDTYWPQIRDTAVAIWDEIYAKVSSAATAIWSFLQGLWGQVTAWWGSIMGGMSDSTGLSWQGIYDWISSTLQATVTEIQTVLGIISAVWNAVWPGLQTVLGGVWTAIQGVIEGALQIILGILQTVLGVLTGDWQMAWQGLVMVLQGVWTAVSGVVSGALQVLVGVLQQGLALLSLAWNTVWGALGPYVMTALDGIYQTVMAVLTPIGTFFSTVFTAIYTTVSSTMTSIWTVITTVWTTISGIVGTALQVLLQVFIVGLALIVGTVALAIDGLIALFGPAFSLIGQVVSAAWTFISDTTTAAWTAITTFISGVWTTISTAVSTGANYVWTVLEAAWASISASVSSWWNSIWSVIESVWSSIYTTVSGWVDYVWSTLEGYWSTISASVSSWWNSIWSVIESIWNSIYSTVSSYIDSVYSYIESIWSSVSDSTSSYWSGIYDTIEGWWSSIYETIGGYLDSIVEWVTSTWDSIVSSVEGFGSSLYDTLSSAFSTAIGRGGEILAGLLNGIADALDGVGDPGGYAQTARDAAGYITSATSFAQGGLGTQGRNDRMHIWNEQMGNEAYIAEKGPRGKQLSYLSTAADWFGMSVVPQMFCEGGMAHGAGGYVSGSCGCAEKGGIAAAFARGGVTDESAWKVAQSAARTAGGILVPTGERGGDFGGTRRGLGNSPHGFLSFEGGGLSSDEILTMTDRAEAAMGQPYAYGPTGTYAGPDGYSCSGLWNWILSGSHAETGYGTYAYAGGQMGLTPGPGQVEIGVDLGGWGGYDGTHMAGDILGTTYESDVPSGVHHGYGAGAFGSVYHLGNATDFAVKGGGGTICKALKAIFQKAADAARDGAKALLPEIDVAPARGFGEWGIDTGIQSFIDWLTSKIPGCGGGSGGPGGASGDCQAIADSAMQAMGVADDSSFKSLFPGLLQCESGCDCGIANSTGSGATGVAQMMPATYSAYKQGSCTDADITDCQCNAMASIAYQLDTYGGAVAGCPYHSGGVIPGTGEKMVMAEGGERVLTAAQNSTFEGLLRGGSAVAGSIDLSSLSVAIEMLQQVITEQGQMQAATYTSQEALTRQQGVGNTGTLMQTIQVGDQTLSQNQVSGTNQITQRIDQQTNSQAASQAQQTAEITGNQTAETQAQTTALGDMLRALGDSVGIDLTSLATRMDALLSSVPEKIQSALSGVADKVSGLGGDMRGLLDVTKYAWGLESGGLVNGSISAGRTGTPKWLVGEGIGDEYVIPTNPAMRAGSEDLLRDLANRFGFDLVKQPGGGGLFGRAKAAGGGGGGGGGYVGWDNVSGKVMTYTANVGGEAGLLAEAAMGWMGAQGTKLLPHYGSHANIHVEAVGAGALGGNTAGLAHSNGLTQVDTSSTSSHANALVLYTHELGHQLGLDHLHGSWSVMAYDHMYETNGYPTNLDSSITTGWYGPAGPVPRIPTYHMGGIIPGPLGQEQVVMAQAGEAILPLNAVDAFYQVSDAFNEWAGSSDVFAALSDSLEHLSDDIPVWSGAMDSLGAWISDLAASLTEAAYIMADAAGGQAAGTQDHTANADDHIIDVRVNRDAQVGLAGNDAEIDSGSEENGGVSRKWNKYNLSGKTVNQSTSQDGTGSGGGGSSSMAAYDAMHEDRRQAAAAAKPNAAKQVDGGTRVDTINLTVEQHFHGSGESAEELARRSAEMVARELQDLLGEGGKLINVRMASGRSS